MHHSLWTHADHFMISSVEQEMIVCCKCGEHNILFHFPKTPMSGDWCAPCMVFNLSARLKSWICLWNATKLPSSPTSTSIAVVSHISCSQKQRVPGEKEVPLSTWIISWFVLKHFPWRAFWWLLQLQKVFDTFSRWTAGQPGYWASQGVLTFGCGQCGKYIVSVPRGLFLLPLCWYLLLCCMQFACCCWCVDEGLSCCMMDVRRTHVLSTFASWWMSWPLVPRWEPLEDTKCCMN